MATDTTDIDETIRSWEVALAAEAAGSWTPSRRSSPMCTEAALPVAASNLGMRIRFSAAAWAGAARARPE
jgi:hypothetical protein